MIGVYLSGTGNTKHCIEKLAGLLDYTAKIIPIESEGVVEEIRNTNTIILAYTIQYSNAPYMVRDFINKNSSLWKGKKFFVLLQWEHSAVTVPAVPQDYLKNMVQ